MDGRGHDDSGLEPARRQTGAAEAVLRAKFPHLEKPHFCPGAGAAAAVKASARQHFAAADTTTVVIGC